jgi:TetR/AcrR family transcriptional repressor of nem operon
MPKPGVRAQIVEAALEQFQQRGFNGCGVKDITDAARVPKGSLYNHFDSKEALAAEVMRRYEADCALESLTRAPGEPVARLRAFFESLRAGLQRRGFARGCLFGNFGSEMADHSTAVREQVESGLARWSAAIAVLLREARDSGMLPQGHDPELLSRFIVDSWQGAVIHAKVAKDQGPLDDFFAVVFGSLLP